MRYGRKAFGPGRKVSKRTQARYIAESILSHQIMGHKREVKQYTPDVETQQLVRALLQQAA